MLLVVTMTATSSAIVSFAGEPQAKLNSALIEINGVELEAEIATTPLERRRGLSFRKSLAPGTGMLFVYQKARPLVFTMQETEIPLSIAFVSEAFVINEIHKMQPFARDHYPSTHPAKYALEVNQGWFEQNGIKAGDQIKLVLK